MSPAKPQDFPLLLGVFREGLRHGIISIAEVISWADEMVMNDDEPDYFFIELSLSNNANRAVEIINDFVADADNSIISRVLLAYIYRKLLDDNDPLTIEESAKLVGKLQSLDELTQTEINHIYSFDDYDYYYAPDPTQLQVDIFNFLSVYEPFNLKNYDQWPEINNEVENALKKEEEQAEIANASIRKNWQEQAKKKRRKKQIAIALLALVIVVIVVLNIKWAIGNQSQLSENHANLFIVDFLTTYFFIRTGYRIWKKRR